MAFPLSEKVTTPVAVTGETTALKIAPPAMGITFNVDVVFVLSALLTVCVNTLDVLPP
jgi:hypothetical protein